MKIVFNIDYRTNWGESLYLVEVNPETGIANESKAVKMSLDGLEHWSTEIEIPDNQHIYCYRYIVRRDDGSVRDEWGKPHCLNLGNAAIYNVYDRWQDQPWDKPFYSMAFTQCICRRTNRSTPQPSAAGMLTFEVSAPMIKADEDIAVVGSARSLGAWNVAKAPRMSDAAYPVFTATVVVTPDFSVDTEFKFVIVKKDSNEIVSWEGGDNRRLGITPSPVNATVVAGLRFINMQTPWRGAGTAIPVFSLRTDDDFGVGEFYDLIPMVDWAVRTGQSFLQILPINDTTMSHTWMDSYPYNANSTFALHPMYLRLGAIGKLNNPERQAYYDALARELNDLPQIDYERVNHAKREYLKELFAQDGAAITTSADFRRFVDKNESWLKPYAAFCVLRDIYGTPVFGNWGEYATYDKQKIDKFIDENIGEILFVYFQQYNLDKQMRHVHEYAKSKGVAIKGDIPIGISRTSVDAWLYPQLFKMNSQAGAPPDDFSVLGQNWGFPTYNWQEMSLDGFAWWKDRFRKMSEYFDAYRIDHVLGFFRIWEIPIEQIHGLLGYFNPALPFTADELKQSYDFWIDPDLHTTPYIMDWFLTDFFGEYTDEARERFLVPLGYGRYRLKDEFRTQRMVADYFAQQNKNEKNNMLCNALLGLIDNVLFIPDPEQPGKYHPRISAQHTYIYRSLTDYERWCFNRLYNDFFYHRHNDFWYDKAMWKLPPLIDATDMLVCAEDLGMIPACVPEVMNRLEILALEIQRMPKDPATPFGEPWNYPYYSVCTTSSHDMSGIRGWWEEDREKTQQYYNNVLHEPGLAPYFAEPWICEKILAQHLYSPSMLCIIPLQDWLSIDGDIRRENPADEQINVPAISRHYWRYRMHLTIGKLLACDSFNSHLRDLITSAR